MVSMPELAMDSLSESVFQNLTPTRSLEAAPALSARVHSSSTESRTVPARLREVVIKYQPFLPQEAAMTESHGLSPQI